MYEAASKLFWPTRYTLLSATVGVSRHYNRHLQACHALLSTTRSSNIPKRRSVRGRNELVWLSHGMDHMESHYWLMIWVVEYGYGRLWTTTGLEKLIRWELPQNYANFDKIFMCNNPNQIGCLF